MEDRLLDRVGLLSGGQRQALTMLMITHNMKHDIAYGNRLIMLHQGRIISDISGSEKENLTVQDLLNKFYESSDSELVSDAMLLS